MIKISKKGKTGKPLEQKVYDIEYDITDTSMTSEVCFDYWESHKQYISRVYKNSEFGCGVAFRSSIRKIIVICLYKPTPDII